MLRSPARLVLLLLVILILALWWFMRAPLDSDRLLAAIPAEARVVSVHRELGPRADTLVTNALTRAAIMAGAGTGPDSLFRLRRKPKNFSGRLEEVLGLRKRHVSQIEEWLEVYSPRESVVAYTPETGEIYVATHLGAKMHTLKTLAGFAMKESGKAEGHTIYELGDMRVAMSEGLLLLAGGGGDLSMSHMLKALKGDAPNLLSDQSARAEQLRSFGDGASDVGLLVPAKGAALPWRVTTLSPEIIEADIALPRPVDQDVSALLPKLGVLYGDLPMAVIIGAPQLLTDVLALMPSVSLPEWVSQLDAPMSLAILGEGYASSFFTLPSVVMTLELDSPEQGADLLATYAAEGETRSVSTNGRTFVELKTGLNSGSGSFAYRDWLSATVVDKRLFIASNTQVLNKLLQRLGTREASFEKEHGRWYRSFQREPAPQFGWIDGKALCGKLDVALAAAGVSLNMSVKEKDQARKRTLDRVRTVIQGLKKLGPITLRQRDESGQSVLHIRGG